MHPRSQLMQMTSRFIVVLGVLVTSANVLAVDPSHVATLWRDGDAGERLEIRGLVMDARGKPVAGAQVNTRQADGSGTYTPAYAASMVTNARGEFLLRTARPGNYGVPMHIHVSVSHPDSGHAFTEIRFKGDPLLSPDDAPDAIALEAVRINGREHKAGTFHVTLSGP